MKPIENKMMEVMVEELAATLNTIQELLILAHYPKDRTEMNTYLGLISACILRVEESVKKSGIQQNRN